MDKFLVLIADDSKTVHNQITNAIKNVTVENKPIELESVYSYQEFKNVYEPNKYALVITDLVMETEDSGINVINHIRHTVNDTKTRIILMTANPEKVPQELLIRDCDINSYIEKKSMNDFSLKLTVISLLKAYKDIVAFEKAINSIEHVIQSSKEMNLEELLIEVFFQVRSFLTLKSSNI
ncbi:MAG: response regulator [Fervidobacterium sp.]